MGGEQTGALIVPDRAGRVLTIGRDPIYPYEFNAQVITEHGDVLTGAAIARAACGLLQTSVGDNANHGYVGDFAPDASAVVALGAGWQKLFWIRKDGSSDSGFTVHAEQATNCTSIRSLAVTDSNVFVVCEGNRETRSNTGNRRLVALRRDGFLDPRFKSSF